MGNEIKYKTDEGKVYSVNEILLNGFADWAEKEQRSGLGFRISTARFLEEWVTKNKATRV